VEERQGECRITQYTNASMQECSKAIRGQSEHIRMFARQFGRIDLRRRDPDSPVSRMPVLMKSGL